MTHLFPTQILELEKNDTQLWEFMESIIPFFSLDDVIISILNKEL